MMPTLEITFNEPAWPDLADRPVVHAESNIGVTIDPHGMSSGAPSVALRLELPDGQVVLAQTSWALFEGAYRAIRGRLDYLAEGGE